MAGGGLGCTREYLVAQASYVTAVELGRSGGNPRYIAVAAVPTDQGNAPPPVYLRASRLEALPKWENFDAPAGQMRVRTPDFRAKRVSGSVLIALGLAHWVTAGAVMLSDLSEGAHPCDPIYPGDGRCGGGLGAIGTIVGGTLGGLGLLLLIPGTVDLAKSYRWPPEVPPGRPEFRYIEDPIGARQ